MGCYLVQKAVLKEFSDVVFLECCRVQLVTCAITKVGVLPGLHLALPMGLHYHWPKNRMLYLNFHAAMRLSL